MKGMHGIIFSYEKRSGLRELIEHRVHGSVPFAGNYRMVDFMLSNIVGKKVQGFWSIIMANSIVIVVWVWSQKFSVMKRIWKS